MWSKLKEKFSVVKKVMAFISWGSLLGGFCYVCGWIFGRLLMKISIDFTKDFFHIED